MISNTFQNNTFNAGLDMDTDIALIGNNKYRYAENVRVTTNDGGTTGVLLNIEGARKYNASLPINEVIIGATTINNIAIIVTKKTSGTFKGDNKVYRVTGFDKSQPIQEVILQGELELCKDLETTPNISIVGNYETDNNIKVYFTDGKSAVKVLNIIDDKYVAYPNNPLLDNNGRIKNTLALDITPGALLPPFVITDLTEGNLPSGTVQYCYQLFTLHGSESTLSALSQIIHLTTSNTSYNSLDYYGTLPNNTSNKACMLTAPYVSKDFEKCRIIRIMYANNNETPEIHIVDEIDINTNYTSIDYIDSGNASMGTITIEEFNALTGYQFIASTIAKSSNRLFAANITEDTWNPEQYDARAYRCNAAGEVVLDSTNSAAALTFSNIDSADLTLVPDTHDCINPYNSVPFNLAGSTNKYVYGKSTNGVRTHGGYGTNIEYNFTTVPIYLSDQQVYGRNNVMSREVSMNTRSVTNLNALTITNVGLNFSTYNVFPHLSASRLPNYADPYIASNFKGYQRDEIYRFGIIFYNKKNIPSPVLWIADIRMPHASEEGFNTFEMLDSKLIGKALGVRFTVKNIPAGAVAYEIVRCDRTEADRSIVCQCAMSLLGEYRILENSDNVGIGDILPSSLETRPPIIMTYTDKNILFEGLIDGAPVVGTYVREWSSLRKALHRQDYVRLVSPEICVSKENIEPYFNSNAYIESCYIASSLTDSTGIRDLGTYHYWGGGEHEEISVKERISSASSVALLPDGSEVLYDDKFHWVANGYTDRDWAYYAVHFGSKYLAYINKYYASSGISPDDRYTGRAAISKAKYPLVIPYNAFENVSAYRTNVGDITYTNYGMATFDKVTDANVALGPAGPCIIANAKGVFDSIPRIDFSPRSVAGINAVPIVNIKRYIKLYGGDTYTSRLNSIYIATNSYQNVLSVSSANTYTYGGDIFLGVLDYPITMTFLGKEEATWASNKKYFGAYIPLESSINMNLFSGDMAHRTYRPDNFIDSHLLVDITQKQAYHVLDKPYYEYNSTYSSQMGSRLFVSSSIYDEDNLRMYNRILSSLAKNNNEVLDNWTQFKVADYLDVDNQYGDITNLKSFKDKLFFWLNTGLGVAAVNERALISDGNIGQLTLGTGGVLSRFDYATTTNGSSIVNDRSIVNSDNVLYWYDYDKNELCSYSGLVNQVSKEKHVQSYLNEMYSNKRKVTLGLFDKKYNEVWFKFYDKSLVFNELIAAFTSFYTFNPEWALNFSDKVVAIKDNQYYNINTLDTDTLLPLSKNAKVQFVVNKDIMYTKVFDNVAIAGKFKDKNNAILKKGILFGLKFLTDSLISNNTVAETMPFDYREDTYRFPIPRQDNSEEDISMSYPARMRGKYLLCDYEFKANDELTFKVPYITTTYRYSML